MTRFDSLLYRQTAEWRKVVAARLTHQDDGPAVAIWQDTWRQIRNEIALAHPGYYGTDEMRAEALEDRREEVTS